MPYVVFKTRSLLVKLSLFYTILYGFTTEHLFRINYFKVLLLNNLHDTILYVVSIQILLWTVSSVGRATDS